MNHDIYIGLMSGTSLDGIDVAVVDFSKTPLTLIATEKYAIPAELKKKLINLCTPGDDGVLQLGVADAELGQVFAKAVLDILAKNKISKKAIKAIGSHGQTIRHVPQGEFPFTLQIGDPNIIAAQTGITTVADFRRRDMAEGGQGAPLAPAFHQFLFADKNKHRAALNIGGIANVTILNNEKIIGFDTGPGNTLMDNWCYKHTQHDYDKNGAWGKTGEIDNALLKKLLADDYFQLAFPKSTGREYFNLTWLDKFIGEQKPQDIQATLTALTAHSIANAINEFSIDEIIVCGGGAHNTFLMQMLRELCNASVISSEKLNVHPDWIEAMAFAWLAKQTMDKLPGNIPSVTGASKAAVLGGVYPA